VRGAATAPRKLAISSDVDVGAGVDLDVNLDGDGDLDRDVLALTHGAGAAARQRSPATSTSPSPSRSTSTTPSRSTSTRWLATCGGLSLVLALAGCGETAAGEQRLPLPDQVLPSLHCAPRPEQAGECARDGDCGEGQRCTLDAAQAADRAPVPLRCGPALGLGEARARCETGDDCESGLCALAGVCVSACVEDADCLLGQVCQPLEVRLGSDALAKLSACARQLALPPDVELEVLPARALRSGQLETLQVDVDADDALLFARVGCARTLQLLRIVQRVDGRVWFDLARQLDGVVQPNPSVNGGALLPLLLPDNPRLSLSPPGYELTLSVDADTELTLLRAQRRQRGTRLDLNVFYVGGGSALQEGGLRPGDARFAEVLARLSARYEQVGLGLGSVREYDVVGSLRDELGTLEVRNVPGQGGRPPETRVLGLPELFELSAGVDDGGINLFLVREMGAVLGISGGIPGAIGVHGTEASGVSIALDVVGLERADLVLFHEMSHQMGLFHSTESDGFVLEPLSDTPSCPPAQDLDQNGILRADECRAYDGDNLMFWEGQGEAVSAQQAELLRRSPVLR
jgi:hypothetical protein